MSDVDVLGRDDVIARLVSVSSVRGAALIGPPGSGLSTVLRIVARRCRERGQQVRHFRFPDARVDQDALVVADGVVLVVDDVHLGSDAQTLALRDRALVAPVIVGARTGASSTQLRWLWRSGTLDTVELDTLADSIIGQIVEHCAGGIIHRVTLAGVVHRSGGRPAFAVDEATSMLAEERLVLQAGLLRGRLTGQIGAGLIERAQELLADLPVGVAAMLETIATAGHLPHEALASLGIDLPELRRRALAERVATGHGEAVRLTPPGLSTAIRATFAPARTFELASAVLGATTRAALARDDRARLLIAAGEHLELDELAAAAWTALRGDDRIETVNLARQIGRRGPRGLAIEADLLAELGARAEAADRYAMVMLDPAAPAALRGRAAMEHSLVQMWDLARPDAAVATATALADATGDSEVGPAARVHLAALTLYSGRPTDALAIIGTIDETTVDSTMRAGRALVETVSRSLADPTRAAPTGSLWLLDRDEGGSFERGVAVASVELSLELVGEYLMAESVVEDAAIGRESRDTPSSAAWAALARARAELAIGRPAPARRAAIESVADFADVNHPSGLRWACGAEMLAAALSGDRAATRDAVERFDRLDPGVPFLDADLLRARAWAAWALGNSGSATDLFRDAVDLAARSGAVTLEAVALHDSFRLLRAPIGRRLIALASDAPAPALVLRARHVESVAAGDPTELLVLSADLERVGALLLAAEAAGDAARLATAKGLRSTARTAVGRRIRLADLCGNPTTPGLAGYQPISLTTRERDVATLAAEGHTSREIATEFAVSVRTVDNLLQRVYVKLGVHRRAELAERLTEHAV